MMFSALGRVLISVGIILILLGGAFLIFNKLGFLGKLPLDMEVHKKNFSFYFPVGTSIVLSLILSLLVTVIFIFYQLIKK